MRARSSVSTGFASGPSRPDDGATADQVHANGIADGPAALGQTHSAPSRCPPGSSSRASAGAVPASIATRAPISILACRCFAQAGERESFSLRGGQGAQLGGPSGSLLQPVLREQHCRTDQFGVVEGASVFGDERPAPSCASIRSAKFFPSLGAEIPGGLAGAVGRRLGSKPSETEDPAIV